MLLCVLLCLSLFIAKHQLIVFEYVQDDLAVVVAVVVVVVVIFIVVVDVVVAVQDGLDGLA